MINQQDKPAHITPEMMQLIAKIEGMKVELRPHINGKTYLVHPHRRHIRNRLFRIRQGLTSPEFDGGLKAWMELQFKPGMTWENFTFKWDISPDQPLKIVSIEEWVACGGVLETYTERSEDGKYVLQTRCSPTAFTNQG